MKKVLSLLGICLLVAIFLPGCLNGEKTVLARYDKDKDELHILTVWQNLRAEERNGNYDPAADLAHLQNLYNNRDHLIFKPFDLLQFFGENAVLRLSGDRYADVDLGSPTEAKTGKSPVDLDKFKIIPGQFFLREPGNLCYYHQVVIPGEQLDQYLKYNGEALCESLAAAIDEEMKRRTLEGFVPDWEKYSKKAVAAVEAAVKYSIAGGEEPPTLDSNLPLSNESLKDLYEAATRKKIAFQRAGSVASLSLQMTRDDAVQCAKLLEDVREKVQSLSKTLTPKDKAAAQQAMLLQKLAEVPHFSRELNQVVIQFDLASLVNAFQAPTDPQAPLEKTQADHAAELAKLAADRLPVNKTITMESVVNHFKEGTLPPNNANPPVKPGEGLKIGL